MEAIRQALQVLPQDNITLKFLLQATGDASTSDVDLAVATKAIIFGFNVRASGSLKKYADNRNVEIRLYKVIYELIDDVRKAMEGLLDLVEVNHFTDFYLAVMMILTSKRQNSSMLLWGSKHLWWVISFYIWNALASGILCVTCDEICIVIDRFLYRLLLVTLCYCSQ